MGDPKSHEENAKISFRGINLNELPSVGERSCRCIGIHDVGIYPNSDPQTFWVYRHPLNPVVEKKGEERWFEEGDRALAFAVREMGFAGYYERFNQGRRKTPANGIPIQVDTQSL